MHKTHYFLQVNAPNLLFHHLDDLNVEISQHLGVVQDELVTVGFFGNTELLGPILVAFDPAAFHLLSHHSDNIGLALPHHLPEIILCAGQWALRGDVEELFCAHLHTNVAGIDVVFVFSDGNARLIV